MNVVKLFQVDCSNSEFSMLRKYYFAHIQWDNILRILKTFIDFLLFSGIGNLNKIILDQSLKIAKIPNAITKLSLSKAPKVWEGD